MKTSQLICEEHNEPIDVYCKFQNCTSEIKICCNSCSQSLHQHQTTRINDLKKDVEQEMNELKKKLEKFECFSKQLKAKIHDIEKMIVGEISYYQDIIDDFDSKSKSILMKAIKKINNQKNSKLTDKINYYVKANSSNPNKEHQNTPDLDHLIIQYKWFLIEDKDEKQALGILNQILQIEKENFIYQRERDRLTHAIVEYSSADDKFCCGQYQQAVEGYNKLLEQRNDSRVHNQKAIALFYMQNYQEALKSIEQAIQFDTNNIQYQITKSQLLFATNNLEGLQIQARNLKDLFQTTSHIVDGQILLLQKENEKAQAEFEKAVAINYFSFESHFFKALAISRNINQGDNQIVKPQQILQNTIDKQLIDLQNFNKYYRMYLKENQQIPLNIDHKQLLEQLFKNQPKNKQNQPINKIKVNGNENENEQVNQTKQ